MDAWRYASSRAREARGICSDPAAVRRNLQYGSGTAARLLRILPAHPATNSWAKWSRRIRRRLDRQARSGRDQPGLRRLRMVPRGSGPALPAAHGAGDREASWRVPRIPHAAGTQSARAAGCDSRRSAPCSSEPVAAACEILDQVRMPCAAEHRGAGRWQARAADRAGAECARLSRAPVRAAWEKLRIARRAGVIDWKLR